MLSAACACLVQQQQQHKVVQTAATTAAVTQQLTTTLAGMHLTREGAAAGTTAGARKSEGTTWCGSVAALIFCLRMAASLVCASACVQGGCC